MAGLLDALRRASFALRETHHSPVGAGLREIHDPLAGLGRRELLDWALHPIAIAIALLRVDPVVVGRLWLEPHEVHAEYRSSMVMVQPEGILRRLAQVLGSGTVVHDPVMYVRTPGVVGCPPDDGQMLRGQLDLWRF